MRVRFLFIFFILLIAIIIFNFIAIFPLIKHLKQLYITDDRTEKLKNDFNSICFEDEEEKHDIIIIRDGAEFFGKCIPPLLPFDAKFRVRFIYHFKYFQRSEFPSAQLAERFKLVLCAIEKNMDPKAFSNANRSLSGDSYQQRFCKGKNEFNKLEKMLSNLSTKVEEWQFLSVVRDPLERFLSGYVDKCINEANHTFAFRKIPCYNCGTNLTCFIQRLYRRAQYFVASRGKLKGWSFEDIHFFPQNWHCQFHLYFAHFHFIQFGETPQDRLRMHAELIDWLLQAGRVPPYLLDQIGAELANSQSSHSTREDPRKKEVREKLVGDRLLRKMFTQIFYFDYALLGLPFGHLE